MIFQGINELMQFTINSYRKTSQEELYLSGNINEATL
jgi:hypothetical protein